MGNRVCFERYKRYRSLILKLLMCQIAIKCNFQEFNISGSELAYGLSFFKVAHGFKMQRKKITWQMCFWFLKNFQMFKKEFQINHIHLHPGFLILAIEA